MKEVMPILCCQCGQVIGCWIGKMQGYCFQCPQCVVCIHHLDIDVVKTHGFCQRHLQEHMDMIREKREERAKVDRIKKLMSQEIPMSKKKRRKVKQRKPKKIDTNLNELAWAFARAVAKLPRRQHVNQTIINSEGTRGCIPYNGLYDYQWCIGCFYEVGCMKLKDPPQWTLNDDGTLIRRY